MQKWILIGIALAVVFYIGLILGVRIGRKDALSKPPRRTMPLGSSKSRSS